MPSWLKERPLSWLWGPVWPSLICLSSLIFLHSLPLATSSFSQLQYFLSPEIDMFFYLFALTLEHSVSPPCLNSSSPRKAEIRICLLLSTSEFVTPTAYSHSPLRSPPSWHVITYGNGIFMCLSPSPNSEFLKRRDPLLFIFSPIAGTVPTCNRDQWLFLEKIYKGFRKGEWWKYKEIWLLTVL